MLFLYPTDMSKMINFKSMQAHALTHNSFIVVSFELNLSFKISQ